MLPANTPFDLTGTVRLDCAATVSDAVARLLIERFPDAESDLPFLKKAFDDVEAAFWGDFSGYLSCDTPYHDLRHALDTALLTARMVDGYQSIHARTVSALSGTEAVLAVFLALAHDTGFLRRIDEAHLCGAQLSQEHEARSVDFVRAYLAGGPLADFGDSAELIHVTCFAQATADVLHGHREQQAAIARMIGSADLISQVSDRCYLERCRDYLYHEIRVAGMDRTRDAAGQECIRYLDGIDLLAKTPGFYDGLVRRRLEDDFGNIQHVLGRHFGEVNPYADSIRANLDYLRRLIGENRLGDGLRRHPAPLLPAVKKT